MTWPVQRAREALAPGLPPAEAYALFADRLPPDDLEAAGRCARRAARRDPSGTPSRAR
ncbi:hypothetical protein ACFVJ8_21945 [Streptomyces yangpuensis]|uniref:hypothetical protein n=1 Tax=Streptomyces yangpuensis TaxID=1648182 RepID=UPI00363C7C36